MLKRKTLQIKITIFLVVFWSKPQYIKCFSSLICNLFLLSCKREFAGVLSISLFLLWNANLRIAFKEMMTVRLHFLPGLTLLLWNLGRLEVQGNTYQKFFFMFSIGFQCSGMSCCHSVALITSLYTILVSYGWVYLFLWKCLM